MSVDRLRRRNDTFGAGSPCPFRPFHVSSLPSILHSSFAVLVQSLKSDPILFSIAFWYIALGIVLLFSSVYAGRRKKAVPGPSVAEFDSLLPCVPYKPRVEVVGAATKVSGINLSDIDKSVSPW